MAFFADRVKETSTTTGTGDFTLAGQVSQFDAFSPKFGTGVKFFYSIVGQTGTEWEVGKGHLSGATTLVRAQVLESSNSDAAVNFSAGTKDVFVTIPGKYANDTVTMGCALASAAGWSFP